MFEYQCKTLCGESFDVDDSDHTPRTLSASKTTVDHSICLEDLPSPPKIPPSRAEGVESRVDQFQKWSHISQTLATDSFYIDVPRSSLRRSALRDISQQERSYKQKRKLRKQVSFAENENSTMYLYSPQSSFDVKASPPDYHTIAKRIVNRPNRSQLNNQTYINSSSSSTGTRLLTEDSENIYDTNESFYDAQTSFKS